MPSNIEAEASLLGAMLIDNEVARRSRAFLAPGHFFEPIHARIYDRILQLLDRKTVVTPVTLKPYFESDEALKDLGGVSYLARLTGDPGGMLSSAELAHQIRELAAQRQTAEVTAAAAAALREPGANTAQILADMNATLEQAKPRPTIEATPYAWRDPSEIPLRPWVLGRWLLRRTVAGIIAPGGSGKSTALAGIALSLATGRPLIGKHVHGGRKRVWIYNLEDEIDELSRSIQAAAKHHGIGPADLDGWLMVDSAMDAPAKQLCTAISDETGFRLLQPVYDELAAAIRKRDIDVLIIDPFVSSHAIEENDNGRVDKVVKAWVRVAMAADCSIVLAHHSSKAGAGEVTVMSSRGGSAAVDAMRAAMVLNRMTVDEAKRWGIAEAERKRYVRIGDDKSSRAPAEAADWFQIIGVDLGNGTEDCPGDNVGVLVPWSPPDPFDDVTIEHLRTVQRRVGSAHEWRESPQSPHWIGNLVAEVIGLDLEEAADKAKVKSIAKEWIKAGALRVEEGPDQNRQARKFVVSGEAE
nr:AAA family ATPase [Novosphingobium marinum]